jgi:hypothetical protein
VALPVPALAATVTTVSCWATPMPGARSDPECVEVNVDPGGTTPGSGRTERASSRPSRPAPTTKATTVPTAIRRVPSVIAVE